MIRSPPHKRNALADLDLTRADVLTTDDHNGRTEVRKGVAS